MAKYKTNAEAAQDLARQLQEKAAQLRPIYDSNDRVLKEKADKLKDEIGAIQNKLMMVQEGGQGLFGTIGGGLAKGVTQAVTAIPDVGRMVMNYATGENKPLLGERLAPGLEVTSEDKVKQGLFGLAQGAGSSLGLGKVLTTLNIGSTATDAVVFDGVPVTQLLTAVGALSTAGYRAGKNWQDNRGVKKLMDELGPDAESTLKKFMLKGQDSTDPRVAGIVSKLRTNPEYAEMFNVLESKATKEALKGARTEVNPAYPVDKTGAGVYQAVQGKIMEYKDAIKNDGAGAFKKAYEYAGDSPIVDVTKTKENINQMITRFTDRATPDAENTVKFLTNLKDRLADGKITVPQLQGWLSEFGKDAAKGESLITGVSADSQKVVAASIFKGLKDDLRDLAKSADPNEKVVGNLLQGARESTRQAVEKYSDFVAQGLPEVLRNKSIASVDTDTLLKTMQGLSPAQKGSLAGVLENTAPEDLKRLKQVMYDDFVQSARTKLPDGTTGVDLKLLANKFNTLDETGKANMAFAVGTNIDDFSAKMKDAENFFKYQQTYAGVADKGKVNPAELSQAGYALTGGSYTGGKISGMMGNIWNAIKGGLSEESTLNYLMSPETKGLLKESIMSPNSQKTLDKISRVLGGADAGGPQFGAAQIGARLAVEDVAAQPAPAVPARGSRPDLDLSMPDETTPKAAPGSRPELDLSYNPADIETKIRQVAEAKGLGQYADLFVRQANQESGYNPYAVSKAGAQGVFQLMPGTAKDLGVTNPWDIDQNIAGGIDYMGQQLKRFNDPALALAAYNAGPQRVLNAGGIPNIPETQDYVRKILGV